eukprot:jgi/Hompol1/3569/HPOL_001622-RA
MQLIASFRVESPFVDRPPPGEVSLFRRNSQHTNSTSTSAVIIDLSDPSMLRQLIGDAIAECEGFQIMHPEKLEQKKRQLMTISSQVASLQTKIGNEARIREAADLLIRTNTGDAAQINTARQQFADTTRKMDDMASEIWKLVAGLIETERTVFKHVSAVLRWQVEEFQDASGNPKSPSSNDTHVLQKKLTSAESRVRELDQHVDVLKHTISRLESEQESLRRTASESQREARRARDERTNFEALVQSGGRNGSTSQHEVNRLKLDLATARAELTDLREELASKRETLATLQTQRDDDQALIESKDRMISNLLGELEEATNQIEMVRAGGRLSEYASSNQMLLEAQLGSHSRSASGTATTNSGLSAQLKQAIIEREKLKQELTQEKGRVHNLETQLRSIKSSVSGSSHRTKVNEAVSDSDTEPENEMASQYSRNRQGSASTAVKRSPSVKSGRGAVVAAAGQEAELRELQRKTRDQDKIIESLRSQAERFTEADEKLMRELNTQIESALGITSARAVVNSKGFIPLPSLNLMTARFKDILEDKRKAEQKLKDLAAQKEALDREVQAMNESMRSRGNDIEIKMSDQRREYTKLQDEHTQVKTRLREAERAVLQVKELQTKCEDLERQLKVSDAEHAHIVADLKSKLTTMERENKEETLRLKEKLEREHQRLQTAHVDELEEVQRELLRETEEVTRRLQREIDGLKASMDQRVADAVELQVSALTRKQQYELEDLKRETEEAKAELIRQHREESADVRRRLESSEAALVTSKQQYFIERERLQEKIDELQEEARTMRAISSERGTEWQTKKKEYEQKFDNLLTENEHLQNALQEVRRELESKTRELLSLAEKSKADMDALRKANDAQVKGLQSKIDEFQSLQGELEKIEKENVAQLKQKEAEIAQLSKLVKEEQARASAAIASSQEAQAEASDQLHRVERLLREAERDTDRYRRMADEKDNEVLNLKKSLRQKDKEILDNSNSTGGPSDASMRRLIEQKDREIEVTRGELRTAVADIAALKRKVEQKDREIEDAKSEMRRRAKAHGDQEGTMEEVDRLQIMLMELKTSRVQLLEDLDNAQHAEQVLKAEVAALKAELEKVSSTID